MKILKLLPASLLLLASGSACRTIDPTRNEREFISEGELHGTGSEQTTADLLNTRRNMLVELPGKGGDPSCAASWEPLIEDGRLEITIVNGYLDQLMEGGPFAGRVMAGDMLYRELLTKHFTDPCISGYSVCGFREETVGTGPTKTSFRKTIQKENSESLSVRIIMTNSSVSLDNSTNQGSQEQKDKSELAQLTFDEGIANSDIVFYLGHARDGGGPDFSPPKLLGGRHVDYGWYQSNRPGIRRVIENIKKPERKAQILGLFACATKPHFLNVLRDSDANMGLILSDKVSPYEILNQALVGALDSAIGQKCEESFQKSLLSSTKNPVRLYGFFAK